jgi:catechol 2,3-dioxygenase-like lactoylglutathione lyase family enzyme
LAALYSAVTRGTNGRVQETLMSDPAFPRRAGAVGAHSLDHIVFSVPDLDEALRFYTAFGLDARRAGERVELRAHGNRHRWVSIAGSGAPKKLEYVSFGCYAEDLDALRQRVEQRGIACAPHPLSDGGGVWLHNPDGVAVQLVVGPKVSPSAKTVPAPRAEVARGRGAAPARSKVARVHPRTLSHALFFTPDVTRMVAFLQDVIGLRLSDHSGDGIAFLHGPHGSDHHLVAFAKSHGPGLHHTSWDVGSLDDVGCGAEQMRAAGYTRGWGVGRHVLGSNYFHYVQDPWGSFCEYSFDIDYVPLDLDWPAADHPPEDSFYVWGPAVPVDFVTNHEQPAR